MRGLYPGRLHDRSAALLQLGYRWPIWIWLVGALRSELGNVFGEHLGDFRLGRLRWSGALGLESTETPDHSLQCLIALASETFELGGQIDSWRLTLGTTPKPPGRTFRASFCKISGNRRASPQRTAQLLRCSSLETQSVHRLAWNSAHWGTISSAPGQR